MTRRGPFMTELVISEFMWINTQPRVQCEVEAKMCELPPPSCFPRRPSPLAQASCHSTPSHGLISESSARLTTLILPFHTPPRCFSCPHLHRSPSPACWSPVHRWPDGKATFSSSRAFFRRHYAVKAEGAEPCAQGLRFPEEERRGL